MEEADFDSLRNWRSFGTQEAKEWDARMRREMKLSLTLGVALWGGTAADAERQPAVPHPEIPAGFGLADLRELLRCAKEMMATVSAAKKFRGFPQAILPSTDLSGTQGFTLWEARCEIVRRAIEHLEKR